MRTRHYMLPYGIGDTCTLDNAAAAWAPHVRTELGCDLIQQEEALSTAVTAGHEEWLGKLAALRTEIRRRLQLIDDLRGGLS